jgi:hypothetical protein
MEILSSWSVEILGDLQSTIRSLDPAVKMPDAHFDYSSLFSGSLAEKIENEGTKW